ncbi:hypothetical protein B4915_03480 [Leucobacter massiliensis]|uniref:Uncharacterized protein n=1 Tax=Leucobacter massiliensis TaxID=1686285 RepID=A0A2S9QRC5_9MICO|nr:hypothetical protein B4915_03480 [Leucobacter massiliensis]
MGRAAFRATHAKTGGKFPPKKGSAGAQPHGSNEAIIKEALRSLDPEQSKIEAAKNPNIVLADEALNENWVNDGNGGMKPATSFQEALDYLASRNAQLFRKQTANDYELTEIVVHLPDNLCIDDPVNVSYVLDENGKQVISEKTGQPLTKPRRIARDPDEARRYFNDAQEFLTEHGIVAGGHDGLHWRTDQYSEHRPHMQLGFDSYAVDPKHPGFLRNEFSRKWFSHRDVVYPDGHPKAGKSVSGKVKLSDYQTAMREHMIERGWPVEAEIDKANEGSYLGKKNYARADNNRIIAEDRLAAAREQEDQNAVDLAELEEADADLEERTQDIAQRETDWLTRKRKLDAREADLDRRDQETADDRLAAQNERREAESLNAAKRAEIARLRALREDVERDLAAAGPAPQPPSYDDMRAEFLGEQSAQLTAFAKSRKRPDGTTMLDDFEDWARAKHAKLTRQGQPVGRYETWRDRTAAAQKRLTMAQLNDAPMRASERDRGHGYGE